MFSEPVKILTQDKWHTLSWCLLSLLCKFLLYLLGQVLPSSTDQEKNILLLARVILGLLTISGGLLFSLIRNHVIYKNKLNSILTEHEKQIEKLQSKPRKNKSTEEQMKNVFLR